MNFPKQLSDEELAGALAAVKHWLLNDVNAPFGFVADMGNPLGFTPRNAN
jgi:hypothetical protein